MKLEILPFDIAGAYGHGARFGAATEINLEYVEGEPE